MELKDYKFAVYGTQGGGLVREVGGTFIFVTKPDCPGLDVGDEMPKEWGITAANQLALQESDVTLDPRLETGFAEFFEAAFAARDPGKITLAQVGEFFPDEVKNRR